MSHTTILRRLQGFHRDHEPIEKLKKDRFRFCALIGYLIFRGSGKLPNFSAVLALNI